MPRTVKEVKEQLTRTMPKADRGVFSKVKVARDVLKERANEILTEYMDVIAQAKVAGHYDVAAKALQWLIEHMPADEDGERMVEVSVDKKQEVIQTGPTGPAIQIGIQVGGTGQKNLPAVKKPKELPAVTAEVIK